jgi:D-alanine-D-alanine ligase
LKALILYCPKENRTVMDAERFSKMAENLKRAGIDAGRHSITSQAQLLRIIQEEKPDFVYSAEYYARDDSGECVSIHAILDDNNIPYIGSSPEVLELVLSKSELKKRWREVGVSTPPFFFVRKSDAKDLKFIISSKDDDYPYILKPDREGNSRGLDESSIVFDQKSLENKLKKLLQVFDDILVEKYLGISPDLREFTVAMIGNRGQRIVSPAEITLVKKKALRIITTEDKDNHHTQAAPVEDKVLKNTLTAFAEKAFDAAGVRDYARLDIIIAGGQVFAIEINGQPMIPDRWFEICSAGAGLDSNQYLFAIFLAGIVRNNEQEKANLKIPPELMRLLPGKIMDLLVKPIVSI